MDQAENRSSSRRELVLLLGLLILVAGLRVPGVAQPFDNDSAAVAYHGRLINQGLPLYGEHHPGHHMPAAYYTFAIVFRLLGDSVAAIKIVLIPWTFLVAVVVYRTGRLLFDRAAGIIAAVICVFLSSHQRLLGLTGEIELWANLPRALGVYLVARALVTRGPGWLWGLVGLMGAWSLGFKAVYVSPIGVGGAVALIEFARHWRDPEALPELLRRAAWMTAGLLAGVAPMLGFFAAEGLLDRFLLTFEMGREYVAFRTEDTVWYRMFTTPLRGMARANPTVLALGLAGFVGLFAGRLNGKHRTRPTYPLAVWLFVALLEAGVTRVNFTHYHLLVIPPLALLAAPVAVAVYRLLRRRLAARSAWVRVPILVLLVATLLLTGYRRNIKLIKHWISFQVGFHDYHSYLVRGWYLGPDLIRVQKVADYIKANTSTEDRIYYWSGDMQLYYLSERRCAADFIWPVDAEPTGAPAKIFSSTTKYILIGQNPYMPVPEWLNDGLARDYVLETVIDEQRIYRRSAAGTSTPAPQARYSEGSVRGSGTARSACGTREGAAWDDRTSPATYCRCQSSKTSSA